MVRQIRPFPSLEPEPPYRRTADGVALDVDGLLLWLQRNMDTLALWARRLNREVLPQLRKVEEDASDDVATSRTITAGTALSGGGDLSADRTINLDITELGAATDVTDADTLAMYDATAAGHVEVTTLQLRGMTYSDTHAADSGGVQDNAQVTTIATRVSSGGSGYSVTLPAVADNRPCWIFNDTADTLKVWAATGETVDAGTDVSLTAGTTGVFIGIPGGGWRQIL